MCVLNSSKLLNNTSESNNNLICSSLFKEALSILNFGEKVCIKARSDFESASLSPVKFILFLPSEFHKRLSSTTVAVHLLYTQA